MIKVTVYDTDSPNEYFGIVPDNLVLYQKWLSTILGSIPLEYREKAVISTIVEDDGCDCFYAATKVYYYRPETEEERLKEEREMIIAEEKMAATEEYHSKLRGIEEKYND